MRFLITVKQLGKKKPMLAEKPCDIPPPATLRDLIVSMVEAETTAYNARVEGNPDDLDGGPPPLAALLSSEAIADRAEVGKIGFGRRYNRKANPAEATRLALAAFEDGMYRVFAGDTELQELDQALALQEGDRLTFIRLTMLASR